MFLLDPNEELTTIKLGTILQTFQTKDLPRLRRLRNYYDGKQAILRKQPADAGRPCNRVVVNKCQNITDNFNGYLTGIPITYAGKGMEDIIDCLNYNDVCNEDNEFLRQALIYGVAYELCYIDEDGKRRFKVMDSRECIPVYDNTINNNLIYTIRFWKELKPATMQMTDDYFVEVYTPTSIAHYRSNSGFSSFELLDIEPHYFQQCPVIVFSLNDDQSGCFEQVMSLQDAYNAVLSDELDCADDFADAYLIMKGVQADADELTAAKRARAFCIDTDADISYLTKNISDAQTENIKTNLEKQIYIISACPNLNDESFYAQSGVAIRYKLVGFENKASSIEAHMRKALQKRIELLVAIDSVVNGNEYIWRDVEITFTRNLPTDLNDLGTVVNQFRGLVADETLLKLLPFVSDVKEEMAKIKAQKEESMAVYANAFGGAGTDDSDEEDEQ